MTLICCFAGSGLMAMCLTGCGLIPVSQPASTAPRPPSGLRPAPAEVVSRLNSGVQDLYFGVNSHVLGGRERRKFARFAPALQNILHDFPEVIIVIEGYSDDRSLIDYNDRLAMERAETVQRLLLNLSFPEDRLRTVGFGFRAPQCVTQDDLCRQKYRRVHFGAAKAMLDDGSRK